mgnify:CR=1 FL=1
MVVFVIFVCVELPVFAPLSISANNKKIEFFEPYHGWPGMNEFLQSVFYSDNKEKIKYFAEIESLQKISNALELSMSTNQWVKLL